MAFGNPSVADRGGWIWTWVSGLRETGAPCLPSKPSICIGSPCEAVTGRRWPPNRLELGLIGGREVGVCEFAYCQPASWPISKSGIMGGGGSGGGAVSIVVLVREAIGNGPWDENASSGIAYWCLSEERCLCSLKSWKHDWENRRSILEPEHRAGIEITNWCASTWTSRWDQADT